MKRAVFPGSFDPITTGHENILRKALPLFDEIIVAIGKNSTKQNHFSLEQREKWIKNVFKGEKKIKVVSYTGLTIDLCKKMKANYILRGLRTSVDFEYERPIALNNNAMAPAIETIFILPNAEFSAISSTIVRDILRNGGDASRFVPKGVNLKAK